MAQLFFSELYSPLDFMLLFNVEIFISLDLSLLFLFISEFELKLQKKDYFVYDNYKSCCVFFSEFYFKHFSVIFVVGAYVLSTIKEIFNMQINCVYVCSCGILHS